MANKESGKLVNKRKMISDVIEIPEGVNVDIKGNLLKLTKDGESVEKEVLYKIKQEGNKLILEHKTPTKKVKKVIKSSSAHIRNMLAGLDKKYLYKLQICAVHFPMNVSIKGQELIIKNFLGEVKERKSVIIPGVTVKIDKDIITIEGIDKEKVGQTAANMESATRICNRDRRIFQDGIYITEKQKGVRK